MALPAQQLDLFYTKTPIEELHDDFKALKESQDKLRRGLFGRLNALSKKVIEQEEELYVLRYKLTGGCKIVEPDHSRNASRQIPFEMIK